MLARPAAIAPMDFADRLAARAIHVGAAAWIISRGSLRCERLTRSFDRAEAVPAPRLGHARVAVTATPLERQLAAQRARDSLRAREGFTVPLAYSQGGLAALLESPIDALLPLDDQGFRQEFFC